MSAPSQSDEIKKKRVREPAGFKIPKKVRTTPTPVSHSQVQPSKQCIVEGCPRTSFEGAVYCGRSCIERYCHYYCLLPTDRAFRVDGCVDKVGNGPFPN